MAATPKPETGKHGADELKAFLRRLRGCVKPKPGEKPFAESWAEYKREEKELEEAKFQRMKQAGLYIAAANSSRWKKRSKSTG